MVVCSDFASSLDCALTLTNQFHIKILVLVLLLAYSLYAIYNSSNISKERSYMHYWGYYLSLVLGWIYVVFSPLFFLLLLNQNISLEVFVTIIGGFYLIMTALFIGMSIYAGSSNVLRIFGIDDWNEIKDKMAERKSKRKYG